MTFQRLLCIFGIHKYVLFEHAKYEVRDEIEGDAVRVGKVFYFKCDCCQKVKRKALC